MPGISRHDLEEMYALAKISEGKEAFTILAKDDCYRVGVGVRIIDTSTPVYFLEVIVKLGEKSSEVNIDSLDDVFCLLKELGLRGYKIFFQDAGSFLCEYELDIGNVLDEYEDIKELI